MKLTYDRTADALVLQITGGEGRQVKTKEVLPGVHVDVDAEGKVVAFELLNASHHAPLKSLEAAAQSWRTLQDLEAKHGVTASTWRVLIRNKRVKAKKDGRDWVVDEAEAQRYMDSRAASGRPANSRKARRKKVSTPA